MVLCAGCPCFSPEVHFFRKSAATFHVLDKLKLAQSPSLRATKALDIWANTRPKTMQHAQLFGFGLDNAFQTCLILVIQCSSHQHWYVQPQTLPTASILSVVLGFMACWGFQFPSSHHTYEVPTPLPNLRYVEVPKSEKRRPNFAHDAGPKKNCPQTSVAGWKASKTHPKISLFSNHQKHACRAPREGVGSMSVTPYKPSLARRASALDHDGQAGSKSQTLNPKPYTV